MVRCAIPNVFVRSSCVCTCVPNWYRPNVCRRLKHYSFFFLHLSPNFRWFRWFWIVLLKNRVSHLLVVYCPMNKTKEISLDSLLWAHQSAKVISNYEQSKIVIELKSGMRIQISTSHQRHFWLCTAQRRRNKGKKCDYVCISTNKLTSTNIRTPCSMKSRWKKKLMNSFVQIA